MSSDVKHEVDELGLDTQDTDGSDVSTDAEDDTTNQEGGEQTSSLDLTDETKEERREREKAQMVQNFATKILLGKMSLNDIPKDQSKWLTPLVEAYVKNVTSKVKDEPESKEDVREAIQFELKVKQVKDAELSAEENRLVSEKYKYYRSRGFSQLDALNESLAYNHIDLSKASKVIPKIQTGSGASQAKEISLDDENVDPNSLSPAELAKLTKKKR